MLRMRLPPSVIRHRRLLAAAALVLVALLAVSWVMRSDTLERRAGLIRPGMTRDEVEALIEAPPYHYRTRRLRHKDWGPPEEDADHVDVWEMDGGTVVVQFDESGLATDNVEFTPAPAWDRIRRRLHW